MYEERWYLCEVTNSSIDVPEPDWSKVPEERREKVRQGWFSKFTPEVQREYLWGTQITFFENLPYYKIKVIE